MRKYPSILDAHSDGWTVARWLTEPQEWSYFHMIYTCPKDLVATDSIAIANVEIRAAKIETIIAKQTREPRLNEYLEMIVAKEKRANHVKDASQG